MILPARPAAEELLELLEGEVEQEEEFVFTAGGIRVLVVPEKGSRPPRRSCCRSPAS